MQQFVNWIVQVWGFLHCVRWYRTHKATLFGEQLLGIEHVWPHEHEWLLNVGLRYHAQPTMLLNAWACRGEAEYLRRAMAVIGLPQMDRVDFTECCLNSHKASRHDAFALVHYVYGKDIPQTLLVQVVTIVSDIGCDDEERTFWLNQRKEVQVRAAEELVRQNRIRFLEKIYSDPLDQEMLRSLAEEWLSLFWEKNLCHWQANCDLYRRMCMLTSDCTRAKELLNTVVESRILHQERKELVDFLYRSGDLVFLEGATPVPLSAKSASSCE